MGQCQAKPNSEKELQKKVVKFADNNMVVRTTDVFDKLKHVTTIIFNMSAIDYTCELVNLWYAGEMARAVNLQKKGIDEVLDYDPNNKDLITLCEDVSLCYQASFDNSIPQSMSQEANKLKGEKRIQKLEEIKSEYEKKLDSMAWADRPVIGDRKETCIVRFIQPITDISSVRSKYPIAKMKDSSEGRIFYGSEWKYSLTIRENPRKGSIFMISVRGPAEKIYPMCTYVLVDGKPIELDLEWSEKVDTAIQEMRNKGLDIQMFARLHLSEKKYPQDYQFDCRNPRKANYPLDGYVLTGIMGIKINPKNAIVDSITKCCNSGIKMIFLSKENPNLSQSIAKKLGVFESSAKVLVHENAFQKEDGDSIVVCEDGRNPILFARWLKSQRIVFCDLSSEDRVNIMKELKNMNQNVAMLTDDRSDTDALELADLSIKFDLSSSMKGDIIVTNYDISRVLNEILKAKVEVPNKK